MKMVRRTCTRRKVEKGGGEGRWRNKRKFASRTHTRWTWVKFPRGRGGIGSRPIYPYARSLAGAFARYLHSDESVCVHRQGVPTFGHVATSNSALAFVSIVNWAERAYTPLADRMWRRKKYFPLSHIYIYIYVYIYYTSRVESLIIEAIRNENERVIL